MLYRLVVLVPLYRLCPVYLYSMYYFQRLFDSQFWIVVHDISLLRRYQASNTFVIVCSIFEHCIIDLLKKDRAWVCSKIFPITRPIWLHIQVCPTSAERWANLISRLLSLLFLFFVLVLLLWSIHLKYGLLLCSSSLNNFYFIFSFFASVVRLGESEYEGIEWGTDVSVRGIIDNHPVV